MRRFSSEAPETNPHQQDQDTPEVNLSSLPEVHRDYNAPEVDPASFAPQYHWENHQWPSEEEKDAATSTPLPRSTSKRKLVIGAILLLIVLAIGLGVGLGVGLPKRRGSTVPQEPSETGPQDCTSSKERSINCPVPSLKTGALNDTSIAAVTTSDGNRHVFFQNINGSIQHVIFSTANQDSIPAADFILTPSPPRNYTPLAVFTITIGMDIPKEELQLFFVNSSGLLNGVRYVPAQVGTTSIELNGAYAVSSDSRSLSVTPVIPGRGDVTAQATLLYESSNGSVNALFGNYSETEFSGGSVPSWQWASVALPEDVPTSHYGPPFTTSGVLIPAANQTVLGSLVGTLFVDSTNATNVQSLTIDWVADVTKTSIDVWAGPQEMAIDYQGGDIIQLALKVEDSTDPVDSLMLPFWVVNGSLKQGPLGSPWARCASPYPFSRLAWANQTSSTSVFVYHQFNESMLLEDQYVDGVGWRYQNVSIPTST